MKNLPDSICNVSIMKFRQCFFTVFLLLISISVSAQWEATTFPQNEYPYSIATTPNGNILATSYPGSGGYIFISTDKGDTWNIADVDGHVYSSYVTVGNTMFFGGRGQHIARTSDDGITWEVFDFSNIFNQPDADIYALAYHKERLYAAVFGAGICFSDDMGETWHVTDTESLIVSYEVDGRNTYTMESFKDNLYAIGANGIWTLDEDGMTWTLKRETWFSGQSMIFKDKLYIAYVIQNGENGIEYTEDGETWQPIPNNAGLPSNDIRGFQNDGTNMFVGTFENGVFYSPDEGTTWTEIEDWPIAFEVPGILVILSIPMDFCFVDDMVFAASFEMGVYKVANPNPFNSINNYSVDEVQCSVSHNADFNYIDVAFTLEGNADVQFEIYDIMGRLYSSTDFGHLTSGFHSHKLGVDQLKPSCYIYALRSNGSLSSGKFIVDK